MPIILPPEKWDEWSDPEVHETDQLNAMLKACPSDWLESVEVSTQMHSPRNKRAEILAPLKNSAASPLPRSLLWYIAFNSSK